MRFFKWFICLGLSLVLLTAAFFTFNIISLITNPILADGRQPIQFQIKNNSNAITFVNTLYQLNLIRSKKMFLSLMRIQGYTNRLKAGIYEIKPGMSAQQLLEMVVNAKVLVETFRIIEGTKLEQVGENLKLAPYLDYKPEDLNAIKGQYPSAEGLLLADTYNYDAGDKAQSLLKTANNSLLVYLESAWQTRSPGLPYKTAYEMLTAASILEKETAEARERKIIAGIIVNRLKRNMPLQMDPTVIYAMGKHFKGNLSHNDLSIISPYNTYHNRGLPPTPIAMVGKEAIDAAAHPQQSNYLYFVAKGDGTHEFSANYNQQKKAIQRYKYKLKEF